MSSVETLELRNAAPDARRRPLTVAVIGATGAVGAQVIGCLERRDFPVGRLIPLASARSAGAEVLFKGQAVPVQVLGDDSFHGVDLAIFAASSSVSKTYLPIARAAGCLVVDNSSAFRMAPDVPLVVPEVNGALLADRPGLVANPNCVAAIAVMALHPLHAQTPVVRVIGATYQSASGAGAAAMTELVDSTAAYLAGEAFEPKVLPHPYAFNLFSHNADVDSESGYNGEEQKAMDEIRKILSAPEMLLSFTCIRVPVLRAHSMSLSVEFAEPMGPAVAEGLLASAPGVRVVNDPAANHYPMPNETSGGDDVLVGRIRTDLSDPTGCTLSLFVCGDQLLKGAALNAVQIAEVLVA